MQCVSSQNMAPQILCSGSSRSCEIVDGMLLLTLDQYSLQYIHQHVLCLSNAFINTTLKYILRSITCRVWMVGSLVSMCCSNYFQKDWIIVVHVFLYIHLMFLLVTFGLFSCIHVSIFQSQFILCIYDLKALTHAGPDPSFLEANAVTLALKCYWVKSCWSSIFINPLHFDAFFWAKCSHWPVMSFFKMFLNFGHEELRIDTHCRSNLDCKGTRSVSLKHSQR